jgi:hypothetical protein
MSVCRFNAIKNGRQVAARRLRPFVLCPIFRGDKATEEVLAAIGWTIEEKENE